MQNYSLWWGGGVNKQGDDTDLTGEIFFAEGGYGRPEILISGGIKNWVMG